MSLYQVVVRFNRYMVECEYRILKTRSEMGWVLIDTWWNVNFLSFKPVHWQIVF